MAIFKIGGEDLSVPPLNLDAMLLAMSAWPERQREMISAGDDIARAQALKATVETVLDILVIQLDAPDAGAAKADLRRRIRGLDELNGLSLAMQDLMRESGFIAGESKPAEVKRPPAPRRKS